MTTRIGLALVAITIGSWHSWASSMPVPASETIRCLRGWWPAPVGGHIHLGLPRVRHQPLIPLDETEVYLPLTKVGNPPLTEVGNLPLTEVGNLPLTKVGNWPPPVEVGNQPPQGLLLNCPPGQREVVMASHGTKGQCRNLQRKPADSGPRHTRSGHHW